MAGEGGNKKSSTHQKVSICFLVWQFLEKNILEVITTIITAPTLFLAQLTCPWSVYRVVVKVWVCVPELLPRQFYEQITCVSIVFSGTHCLVPKITLLQKLQWLSIFSPVILFCGSLKVLLSDRQLSFLSNSLLQLSNQQVLTRFGHHQSSFLSPSAFFTQP